MKQEPTVETSSVHSQLLEEFQCFLEEYKDDLHVTFFSATFATSVKGLELYSDLVGLTGCDGGYETFEELRTATATQGSAAAGTRVPAVAHALGEATRTASSCAAATEALVATMENLEQRLIGRMGMFEGVATGVDRRASKLRFARPRNSSCGGN